MASNADETTICRIDITTLCFGYFFAKKIPALSMNVPKMRPAKPNVSDSKMNVGIFRGSSTFPSNGINDLDPTILYMLEEVWHRFGPDVD